MIHEPREELLLAALDRQLVLSERFPDGYPPPAVYIPSVLVLSSPVGYGRAQRGIVGYGRVGLGQGRVWHGMPWCGMVW